MVSEFTVEFGRPEEREAFIRKHERFFERIGNLLEALKIATIKVNTTLSNAEIVIDALCTLCAEDFNQVRLLSANGCGHGALTILRGMFEKLVTARYLELHPHEVYKFWDYHVVKVSKLKLDDILKKLDPDGSKLAQFKVASKQGGRKRLQNRWTNIDFVRMAEEVGLGEYVRNAYHFPLEFAHPSVIAVLSLFERIDGQLTIKENGPQPDSAKMALSMAHFFLLNILLLQVEHYKIEDNPIFQQSIDDYVYIWGKERPSPDEPLI